MSTSMNRSRLGTPGRFSSEPLTARVAGLFTAAVERVVVWQERTEQRRHLVGLDDRMLRDIGLNRSDVMREYMKAPWEKEAELGRGADHPTPFPAEKG